MPTSGCSKASRKPTTLHIKSCPDCADAAKAFGRLEDGLRALSQEIPSGRLSSFKRTRILAAAREAAAARGMGADRFLGWLGAASRVPAMATLVAAFLIVGFAYFRTSVPVQELSLRPIVPAGPSDVKVSQNGRDIVLEWSDGRRDAYIVRQASSAKAVYSAPGVEVRGHRYVDRSPSDAAVVYYLVE